MRILPYLGSKFIAILKNQFRPGKNFKKQK